MGDAMEEVGKALRKRLSSLPCLLIPGGSAERGPFPPKPEVPDPAQRSGSFLAPRAREEAIPGLAARGR